MTAPNRLETEIEELKNLAADVVRRARTGGADVAEAIARSGSELSTKVRLGEPELVEEASHKSLGMRVIKQGRVALTSTSDLTARGIDRFVRDALELVDISQEDPFAGPADPSLIATGPFPDLELYDPKGGDVTAAEAIDIARRAEQAARDADPRITNSDGATFSRTAGVFALVLSGGFTGGYAGSYASLVVSPVADDEGGKKRRGFHWTAKRHLDALDAPEAVGREATRRTLRKLGARKVPTCEAPVVFDPDAARAILGLLAGAIMGSSVWRKSSYLVGREGTRVASDLVTIVDDPLVLRAPGSRPFDGEGLAARKNLVVEQGILKTYLCDSYSGRKLGRPPTGSASRGGGGGVGPSTSNFMLLPTQTKAADIVKSTPRGLYVTEMMGFGYNPVTGDFSRGAAGFWIENGELAFPVSEVTISLNLDQLWQRIDAVGDDLDLRSSTASPTLRISSMTIAGSS
ncbi:TldD/PmbA family protein [Polyangium mundeleinium]|uniref:Metallopeptidase TldD-related protein n=1 Tax=Polyangium mundeleinium TaxID=2995306 RepID=A0ABT5EZI0_9BACT|nr:metallopeptidase TldD-related protein [Polyangium mundeleinium]MDC0747245.1 metallopeptidase TldD-related protein [Polyangium mundeleinium]